MARGQRVRAVICRPVCQDGLTLIFSHTFARIPPVALPWDRLGVGESRHAWATLCTQHRCPSLHRGFALADSVFLIVDSFPLARWAR
ncbi:hypothetical protein AMD24_00031 [Candidatus Xiphinematobacter sp. Idaho Grape]|nr:hypothetical protein AMD24_00031 [Candidatus Xiphinematobacter sp. Idaho Grape]